MQTPPVPHDETTRLKKLKSLKILDTPPEERFDRVTRLAQRLFGADIALVSLVDSGRQWFKSSVGLDVTETPRDVSFCGHAIVHDEIMVVSDALEDPRFVDNPLVTGGPQIRFYAGSPIIADDGSLIGTLCIIDPRPRELNAEELLDLRDLTALVEHEIAAERLATVDELTSLANRRGMLATGEHALALSRRSKQPVMMLFFDLDFKRINDDFGHAEGDRALRDFGRCLLRAFRDSDVVARIGGDEFCVLTAGSDENGLKRPLDELDAELGRRNLATGGKCGLRYSVGTAAYDASRHASITDLIDDADRRMYATKMQAKRALGSAA